MGCLKNCRVVASSFEEPGGSVNRLNTRVRRFFGERWRRVSGRGGSLVPFSFSNDRNRRVLKQSSTRPRPGLKPRPVASDSISRSRWATLRNSLLQRAFILRSLARGCQLPCGKLLSQNPPSLKTCYGRRKPI
jgi:hypothetical protein